MPDPIPEILLVPRRQPDLQNGHPDYHVYAGEQLIARFYQVNSTGWVWSINGVLFDSTVDWPMKGHASDLAEARRCVRQAFDKYLPWALAIPKDDLKYLRVSQDLRQMGAR
jgi:hypothetical protein